MDSGNFEVVDDGSVRDKRGRVITPKAERERIARESYRSGMTLRSFAASQGVNYHTLITWREVLCTEHPEQVKALRSANVSDESNLASINFLECDVPGASMTAQAALSVTLPDGLVLRGSDASALATLTKALRC